MTGFQNDDFDERPGYEEDHSDRDDFPEEVWDAMQIEKLEAAYRRSEEEEEPLEPDPGWYEGDEDEMRAKSSPEEFEAWLRMRDSLGVSAKHYDFLTEDDMREILRPDDFEKWKRNRDAWKARTSAIA